MSLTRASRIRALLALSALSLLPLLDGWRSLAVRAAQSGASQVPANLRATVAEIDALAGEAFERDQVGSVTIGLVADGALVWTRSYGFADMEKRVPASRDTVYRIGSITKQFTGLMLLQLVERGKVRLSDPVEKYFPEVNQVQGRFPGAPPITLVQLATMTSGLAREPEDLATFLKGPVREWEKVLVSALPKTRYAHEPDTRYLYSNIGYAILGAALARAAGEPFTEYITQNIFKPLGMTHTAFERNDSIRPGLARGYVVRGTRTAEADEAGNTATARAGVDTAAPEREHEGRGYKVPNGAIYTTVGDLARFVAFELGAEASAVLKKATLADAYSRVHSSDGNLRTGYGIGFQLTRRGDVVMYGHGGSVAGYNAAAHFERTSGTGVIVLRNASGGTLNVGGLATQALQKLAAARAAAAR